MWFYSLLRRLKMKRKELEEKIQEIITKGAYQMGCRDVKLHILKGKTWKGKDKYDINMEKMYSHMEFTFDQFDAFSKLFETENLNLKNGDFSPGCGSCDFGSSYETTLEVIDSPLIIEEDDGDSNT